MAKNAHHMWAIMIYGDKDVDHLKLCASRKA